MSIPQFRQQYNEALTTLRADKTNAQAYQHAQTLGRELARLATLQQSTKDSFSEEMLQNDLNSATR